MNQAVITVMIVLTGSVACYVLGYSAGWHDSKDEIVLGLVKSDGYYIVNDNYGSFKLNATNQSEAIKGLLGEISPCTIFEYMRMNGACI